ncbi:hypothetical protein niasHT_020624 [Heterodera trifolii]|uniref:Ground-like domain-containing protein n=1 Tax=Heterodera trifolii TaxID=157864 RepID=A0ABD2KL68_9BILA
MPHLCITVTIFVVFTLLTTLQFTDTKKTQNDSDTNSEIDNETIGDQQKNNATTEQLIQQLVQQLQQIQQKILVIQKNLPKQQKQEISQRRVEAVQQQPPAAGVVKLNTARLNNNSTVDERKTNSSLKAQIKEFRHRFAPSREQFRKLVRAKDQPQPQIATSIDKTILKEAPRVPSRQPLPVAKHETNKPSNESQNFANQPPQHLPMAATENSSPIRTSNQTQSNANIIDKETESSSNSSSIAVKCPKIEWQKIIEKAIKRDDPNTSIKQLQAELANIERGIFVVMCSMVNQREQFAKNLKLKGDTFCQVIKDNVWCHAGGLSLKNGATFQIGR